MTVTDSPPDIETTPQQYELSGWDLSELLSEPSEEVISQRLGELEEAVARFEAVRPELTPGVDPGRFIEVVKQYENLHELLDRLTGYAALWFSQDTQSRFSCHDFVDAY